jgi:hypothetical protein
MAPDEIIYMWLCPSKEALMWPPRGNHLAPLLSTQTHVQQRTFSQTLSMFGAIFATFLHVSVDQILGDVLANIIHVFFPNFPRFLEHHKKHGFLIVELSLEAPQII